MNIINITDDYDICNCTNESDNAMVIEISPLYIIIILITPCAIMIICGLSFLICNFIKFFKKQMYILNCSDIENDEIIVQALIYLSTTGILFLCLIGLIVYTLINPLL